MPSKLIEELCEGGFGCDCVEQRVARREYLAGREAQLANLKGHGTRSKYKRGCRCPVCTKVNTIYHKNLRASKK